MQLAQAATPNPCTFRSLIRCFENWVVTVFGASLIRLNRRGLLPIHAHLLPALLLSAVSVVLVPMLMLRFLGTQYSAQAAINYAALDSAPPLAHSLLMQLASVELTTWLPALLAVLSWAWLFEGRLLTVALGWDECAKSAQEVNGSS